MSFCGSHQMLMKILCGAIDLMLAATWSISRLTTASLPSAWAKVAAGFQLTSI